MDAVDDALQYNFATGEDNQPNKDNDQNSAASDDSFEAIPDEQDSDEDICPISVPVVENPSCSESEDEKSSTSTSEVSEDTTWLDSSMTKSDIEVLTASGQASMTTSDYVITASQPSVDNPEENSAEINSATESSEALTPSTAPDELTEVADMMESFLKPITEQNIADGIEVIEDVGGGFPNLNGAGDHSIIAEMPTLDAPPSTVVTTSGAAQLDNIKVVDLTEDSDDGIGDDDGDDDFEDETVTERLWGLTEMFPDCVRSGSQNLFNFSLASTKFCYTWGRKGLWVVSTSFMILCLPVLIESERMQMEKESLGQAQDVLLGSTNQNSKGVDQSAPPMPTMTMSA
ncbi:uncharacterized protein LOC142340060 [Convolutriloba macropyga]|uniref:uncharacterized protein LOC142340060 n=1 Tax=Convolutriloba macropyga TaxID=536237 RepID=UPI003F52415A